VPLRPLQPVDDPRRSRQPTTPSGVRSCTTLRPLERDGDIRSNRPLATGNREVFPDNLAGAGMFWGTPEQRASEPPHGGLEGRGGRAHWKCALAGTATGPRRRPGCSSRFPAQAENRDRRTLEGETKAHGRIGHFSSETAVNGTDPSAEQSLEVDAHGGMRIERRKRQRDPGRFEHRYERTARGHRPW
jgi:hypothetical protein